jgi:hypothetical protein
MIIAIQTKMVEQTIAGRRKETKDETLLKNYSKENKTDYS